MEFDQSHHFPLLLIHMYLDFSSYESLPDGPWKLALGNRRTQTNQKIHQIHLFVATPSGLV